MNWRKLPKAFYLLAMAYFSIDILFLRLIAGKVPTPVSGSMTYAVLIVSLGLIALELRKIVCLRQARLSIKP
jgi:hypothetical protein